MSGRVFRLSGGEGLSCVYRVHIWRPVETGVRNREWRLRSRRSSVCGHPNTLSIVASMVTNLASIYSNQVGLEEPQTCGRPSRVS